MRRISTARRRPQLPVACVSKSSAGTNKKGGDDGPSLPDWLAARDGYHGPWKEASWPRQSWRDPTFALDPFGSVCRLHEVSRCDWGRPSGHPPSSRRMGSISALNALRSVLPTVLSSNANTIAVSKDDLISQVDTDVIHNNSSDDSTVSWKIATNSASVGGRPAIAVLLQKHKLKSSFRCCG